MPATALSASISDGPPTHPAQYHIFFHAKIAICIRCRQAGHRACNKNHSHIAIVGPHWGQLCAESELASRPCWLRVENSSSSRFGLSGRLKSPASAKPDRPHIRHPATKINGVAAPDADEHQNDTRRTIRPQRWKTVHGTLRQPNNPAASISSIVVRSRKEYVR